MTSHTSTPTRAARAATDSAVPADIPADAPLLELRGIRAGYHGTEVLRGVDLVAPQGILAVLGLNGAGKSTLLDIVTTLAKPSAGQALLLGVDTARSPHRVRALVRVAAQSVTLDGVLTGRENLELFGRLLGLSTRQAKRRADELLERFDLTHAAKRRAVDYSGGMRRRLDLAAAIVDRPGVLILDEPTTGLDPASRAELWDVLRDLRADGTSIILTTQMLAEAEALADLVAVLHEGRIAATGTPAELSALVGTETIRLRSPDGGVALAEPSDGTARDIARLLGLLGEHQLDLQVELDRPTLDDAFALLTGTRTDTRPASAPNRADATHHDSAA